MFVSQRTNQGQFHQISPILNVSIKTLNSFIQSFTILEKTYCEFGKNNFIS
jgi:hypothetical protein